MISILITLTFAFLILYGIYRSLIPREPIYLRKQNCDQQPHLQCPMTVRLTDTGGISADGHFKCCKYIKQLKATNRLFCSMTPGKDYNGMLISESVHNSALSRKEYYDNLDDTGPLIKINSELNKDHRN